MREVGRYDVQLAQVLAADQQVVSEIAADDDIDRAHEIVGTYVDCSCALDRHWCPRGIDEGGTF